MNLNEGEIGGIKALKKIGSQNIFGKMAYLFGKELMMFVKSVFHDRSHTRNIIYVWVSIYSSSENGKLFNALLLIDIINKIKTLSQVLSIFNENKIALGSTLLLFMVLLYIAAFFSFQSFRQTYQHAESDATREDLGNPDFNMYCDTLI